MDRGAIRRRLTVGLAVLTASGLLAVAAPTAAQAAAPTRCEGRKVKTYPFSTGTLYVYKKRGHVCAIVLPERPGRQQTMKVSVQAFRANPVIDEGQYTRRAGPVTVHAGQRCVWVKGRVGSGSVSKGWILC
ncbi:hypothetical protein ACM01_27065 [Streptomyces viridochromogenes]|uniref:Secreted protein n=1 Tax=Streptomyces viridochromogenes TaxID=1938 RepID=A0A0J7Z7D7_STRVR|nr:hypothetical protein [Streptomyces viridochromogenes]KMS71422.1 hypothetical protein ACM01_27065 [Streptomyces viridochromogenes]KOG17161.1 hypothetical protein ADK35_25255 [Streptomyces viridochromogenes]KOG20181.1 hypothetical protein ADK36_17915 [Streptomyces viridochromogenes]